MQTRRIFAAALAAVLVASGPRAFADLLTFDDLPSPGVDLAAPIPNGYGGLQWSNFWYIDPDLDPNYAGSGYDNVRVSDPQAAFNAFADPAAVFDGVFNFHSAYLAGAWNDGLNVRVDGLLNGNTIYSQTVVVNTNAPSFFNFNYNGIDELRFSSFGGVQNPNLFGSGTHFAMDNFSYTIPEPSSIALGGLAALALVAAVRRRSR